MQWILQPNQRRQRFARRKTSAGIRAHLLDPAAQDLSMTVARSATGATLRRSNNSLSDKNADAATRGIYLKILATVLILIAIIGGATIVVAGLIGISAGITPLLIVVFAAGSAFQLILQAKVLRKTAHEISIILLNDFLQIRSHLVLVELRPPC